MKAKLYKADGTIHDIVPKNGKNFTGDELHELIGGYIEILELSPKEYMVVDEDGRLKELPQNENASGIRFLAALHQRKVGFAHLDYIVGDAVICDKTMIL